MKQQQQQSKCSDSRAGGSGDDQVRVSDVELMTGRPVWNGIRMVPGGSAGDPVNGGSGAVSLSSRAPDITLSMWTRSAAVSSFSAK